MTYHINNYFTILMEQIDRHGGASRPWCCGGTLLDRCDVARPMCVGDVVKFSGDAIIVLFYDQEAKRRNTGNTTTHTFSSPRFAQICILGSITQQGHFAVSSPGLGTYEVSGSTRLLSHTHTKTHSSLRVSSSRAETLTPFAGGSRGVCSDRPPASFERVPCGTRRQPNNRSGHPPSAPLWHTQ